MRSCLVPALVPPVLGTRQRRPGPARCRVTARSDAALGEPRPRPDVDGPGVRSAERYGPPPAGCRADRSTHGRGGRVAPRADGRCRHVHARPAGEAQRHPLGDGHRPQPRRGRGRPRSRRAGHRHHRGGPGVLLRRRHRGRHGRRGEDGRPQPGGRRHRARAPPRAGQDPPVDAEADRRRPQRPLPRRRLGDRPVLRLPRRPRRRARSATSARARRSSPTRASACCCPI